MRKLKLLLFGMLCTAQFLWAQSPIQGKVIDAKDGSPIPGVTVTLKNTKTGTVTGPDGSFSINAPANSILQFTYVGFQTVQAPAQNNLTVRLASGENSMSEVVVVGYGTRIRKDITGSVARVGAKELANTPVTSF